MIRRKMSAGIWALVVLLSGLGMLGIFSVPVVAPPNMHFFSGSITFNALNAPANTEVFAEIDGTLYGQDSVFGGTGGYDGSVYSLTVSGEDTANATAKEGGVDGEPIIFWVLVPGQPQAYIANQAPVYNDGSVDTLNLLVQSAGQPTLVTMNQVAPTNVSDWIELYNPAAASNVDLSADWNLEDSSGGNWAFTAADVLPPLDVSPVPHSVNLVDADGNAMLVWTDPLGTIAAGNPVVMDKIEWGPHIGDTEASGGDTIGLDKGAGSVWDPNLPNCVPDDGYRRTAPGVDTDTAADWEVCILPIPNPQLPQLWPPGPGGYLNPIIGDPTTMFVWQVWYAHPDNIGPQVGSPMVDIYSLSGPLPGSPFIMTFISMVGAPGDYVYPVGGAIYAYQTLMPVGTDWCYVISATDTAGMSNSTAEFCDPDVGDTIPPEINGVFVNGLDAISVSAGTMVTLTADVDDTNTGASILGGADWDLACTGPWNAMGAQDGAWDEIIETGVDVIDTTGWIDGAYPIYVQAYDIVPNYNTSCPFATINIISVDLAAPDIFAPRVNGLTQVTVAPGTAVDFTAIIDDTNQFGSNIGGAMYDVNLGPDLAMAAQDGAFDTPNETVTVTIDTTGWATGSYLICVADAWDAAVPANHNTAGIACATIDIDGTEPSVSNIRLDGITISHTVSVGSTTTLTANIDDSGLAGNSNVANASFSFEGAMGIAMLASDGAFDGPIEDVTFDIITGVAPYVAGGPYTICVSGSDVLGNDNTNGACIQLTIGAPDTFPPLISGLTVDQQAAKTITAGSLFTFNGTVDDTTTGPSNIANATYLVRDGAGVFEATGVMAALDGAFDSFMEVVTVVIDTAGWPDDTYSVHIFACDIIPNCNYGETEQATVTVSSAAGETEPPIVSNVAADTTSFIEGSITTITLTANVDDTTTGGSNIGGANYTVGQTAWPGTLMDAADGTYDGVSEDVTVDIDVFGWTDGTYDLYVYGSDEWGNSDTTITEFVTITVLPTGADVTEPTMGTPTATSPEEGETATISITVSDDVSSGENLTVTITITGPGATPIVTNQDMGDPVGTTFSYETVALTATGGYSYTITATDEAGNSDTRTGTFTVSEIDDQPDGIAWWIWLLLIIIIVVIVIVVIVAMRKKPEEEIPEAPLEEEEELLPEEELPPEEEAFVEEEFVEEAPPEEVVEEAPPEEVVEEPAPAEEAPMEEAPAEEAPAEEAPAEEEAAPGGPISCPNCGTVNPEGISVCTSCGSPL